MSDLLNQDTLMLIALIAGAILFLGIKPADLIRKLLDVLKPSTTPSPDPVWEAEEDLTDLIVVPLDPSEKQLYDAYMTLYVHFARNNSPEALSALGEVSEHFNKSLT